MTQSQKPILCNDVHLSLSAPGLFYLMHLQAPGINAIGASLPLATGIIIGRNDKIAWGVT